MEYGLLLMGTWSAVCTTIKPRKPLTAENMTPRETIKQLMGGATCALLIDLRRSPGLPAAAGSVSPQISRTRTNWWTLIVPGSQPITTCPPPPDKLQALSASRTADRSLPFPVSPGVVCFWNYSRRSRGRGSLPFRGSVALFIYFSTMFDERFCRFSHHGGQDFALKRAGR